MQRVIQVLVVLALLLSPTVMATPAKAQGIVYTIVNDAVDQNGWTLSGTITNYGTGPFADIIGMNLTVTNGSTSYTFFNDGYGGFGPILVTANAIVVPYGSALDIANSPEVLS